MTKLTGVLFNFAFTVQNVPSWGLQCIPYTVVSPTVRGRVGGGPESEVRRRVGVELTEYVERVTGRTWLQLMCCAHSYDMRVYPIILGGRRSELGGSPETEN